MGRTDIEREEQTDADDGMSLNAFLSHRTSGGSGEFLEPWRDKGSVRIWLHTQAGFHALWNHNLPTVVAVKDKQSGGEKLIVVSKRFVCHDPETTTRKARFKDDDGRREHAPVRCPMCFMLDWISAEIVAGRLDWCAPLFKFEGDDPEKTVVLHAGGMVGLFGKKDISKDEQQQMKRAGVSRKNAWREKVEVRCQYLFQVVDDADPSAGVVKALEAGDLGDKLKEELRREIKKRGERGNPGINPYPLLWEYDEHEEQFGKKYKVTALSEDKPTRAILNLIRGPKLDLTKDTAPGNCIELRAALENHLVEGVELPFDEFFAEAERAGLMDESRRKKSAAKPSPKPAPRPAERDEDDEEDEDEEEDEPESAPPAKQTKPAGHGSKAEAKTQTKPAQKKPEPASTDGSPCDFCGEPIGDDDLVCPHCGSTYDDDGENIVLDGAKCLDCGEVVPLKDGEAHEDRTEHICPKCASVHALSPSVDEFYSNGGASAGVRFEWKVVKRHPKKDEPKPAAARGRRGGRVAPSAEKVKESAPNLGLDDGDRMNW